jgi:hypothetical protein
VAGAERPKPDNQREGSSLTAVPLLVASIAAAPAQARRCDPAYKGACPRPNVSDHDCAGGSGNGPYDVRGPIRVVGYDHYRLDADGDGIACEELATPAAAPGAAGPASSA